ncbi:winged helix-turn-helix transcriptional regulator [Sulfitobacter sp. F26204]|uniref:winged helix-turn-helix transcriptional regulator n=1 Tax=Sulfitobacter sp. F26204 TaxID=2996014 RepID=UPI00225DCFAD|nr:winged helix-turn-helix transcriptional regulator [Sulfitobacter sp. F26204]MCX7558074.1 winged helix-turn-helix transcriptional regulator [Sulfitobacter sp. F26204]
MYIDSLVNITSKAWALPILSSLHEGVAGRQATLLAATGAGRAAFAQSMEHLVRIGLMERNPGHGHPLRPEFRLTAAGIPAAAMASKILNAAGKEDHDLLRRTWTVPILTSLHTPCRFNEIKRNLSSITDRALSQSLRIMEDRSWVYRNVNETARPPWSVYSAINTGNAISRITGPEVHFFQA